MFTLFLPISYSYDSLVIERKVDMAKINRCIYCQKNVVGANWCDGCRSIEIEDICALARKALVIGTLSITDDALKKRILEGGFRTAEEARKSQSIAESKAMAKARWKLDRDLHLKSAAKAFERKFPDPDPPQY